MRRYLSFPVFLLLAACAGNPELDPVCPATGFLDHADSITYFTPEGKEALTAKMHGMQGLCRYSKKKDQVEVDLTVPFFAQREPGVTLAEQQLPYFVALLDANENVLSRQAFTTTVEFKEAGTGRGKSMEEHTISIPVSDASGAVKHKLVVGFALTPAQLKYNEEH